MLYRPRFVVAVAAVVVVVGVVVDVWFVAVRNIVAMADIRSVAVAVVATR
jgi:hypothetical protein